MIPEFSGLIPAIVIALLWLAVEIYFRRQVYTGAYRFTGSANLPAPQKTWRLTLYRFKNYFLRGALLFLLIALSGPRLGIDKVFTNLDGIAVNLLIDRSGSMKQMILYRNQEMSRLDAVKIAINDYLDFKVANASASNDLIAVSTFSGFYEDNSPFTSNYEGIKEFVDTVTYSQEYEDGTMIGDALYQSVLRFSVFDDARNDFNYQGSDIKSRIIILLTDGQQTEGGLYMPEDAADFAASKNIKIYTIAIANQTAASILGFNLSKFLAPDTQILEDIAKKTNGQFVYVESGDELEDVYKKIDELEKGEIPKTLTVYEEKYVPFLYIGSVLLLLFVLVEFFIAEKLI